MIYINYNNYKNARDAAWQLLIDISACELPISISDLLRQLNVRAVSYKKGADYIEKFGLMQFYSKSDGFALWAENSYMIFYDDSTKFERQRYTIAHEIGHILLGHIVPGCVTIINREPHPNDNENEIAANIVAVRLLAPACVLHYANIVSTEEIAECCKISLQAAEFRAERLELLKQRKRFLTSPLERQVYTLFREYIKTKNQFHRPLDF